MLNNPMDFKQEYMLEDDRVRLTPLCTSDYQHLLSFAIHEPEIWTYSLIQAGSPEALHNYIHAALQARKQHSAYAFTVFDKRMQQYAGSTRFYDIQPEHASLQLGYTWYGKDFQGTGLNKHTKYLLLQFAFEQLHMERVEFRADIHNKRSIQAMLRIGCKTEGVLRSHALRSDGTRRDSIVLSILKNEWYSDVKDHLISQLNAVKPPSS